MIFAVGARAQSPTPTPTPAPAPTPASSRPPPVAHLRFWNFIPPPAAGASPAGTGDLQLLAAEGQPPLVSTPAGSFLAGYIPVRPGGYNLLVRRPGTDPATDTLTRLPATLRPDAYVTVLITARDGRPTAELVDDTPDPKAPPNAPGRLTVRQFMPNQRVTVFADGRVPSGELLYGESRILEDLPPKLVALSMFARPVSGGTAPPRAWNTEVQFSGPCRRATLLIIGDAYGRFRPRLTMDGPQFTPEPAPAAGPAGPSPSASPSR